MVRPRPWLTIAAILTLAACGSAGTTPSPTSAPPSQPPVTVAPTATPEPTPPPVTSVACEKTNDTGGAVAVDIVNYAFDPGTIDAKVGQPIAFTNRDNTEHGASVIFGCSTGKYGKGKSGTLVFSQPGTFSFICPVHPEMTGRIRIAS
jgi:plastocyanin